MTGKNAKENFHQDPAGDSPYKGQFYNFIRCIFSIINKNYPIRYPNITIPNPFAIKSENDIGEESHSLGKYILKVFRLSSNNK